MIESLNVFKQEFKLDYIPRLNYLLHFPKFPFIFLREKKINFLFRNILLFYLYNQKRNRTNII